MHSVSNLFYFFFFHFTHQVARLPISSTLPCMRFNLQRSTPVFASSELASVTSSIDTMTSSGSVDQLSGKSVKMPSIFASGVVVDAVVGGCAGALRVSESASVSHLPSLVTPAASEPLWTEQSHPFPTPTPFNSHPSPCHSPLYKPILASPLLTPGMTKRLESRKHVLAHVRTSVRNVSITKFPVKALRTPSLCGKINKATHADMHTDMRKDMATDMHSEDHTDKHTEKQTEGNKQKGFEVHKQAPEHIHKRPQTPYKIHKSPLTPNNSNNITNIFNNIKNNNDNTNTNNNNNDNNINNNNKIVNKHNSKLEGAVKIVGLQDSEY